MTFILPILILSHSQMTTAAASRRDIFRGGALAFLTGGFTKRMSPASTAVVTSEVEALRASQLYASNFASNLGTWNLNHLSHLDNVAQWARRNSEAAAAVADDLRLLREPSADHRLHRILMDVYPPEPYASALRRVNEQMAKTGTPAGPRSMAYAKEFATDLARLEVRLAEARGRQIQEISQALQFVIQPQAVLDAWLMATNRLDTHWSDDLSLYDDEFVRLTLEGLSEFAPAYANFIEAGQLPDSDGLFTVLSRGFGIVGPVGDTVRLPLSAIHMIDQGGKLDTHLEMYADGWAKAFGRLQALREIVERLGESSARRNLLHAIERLASDIALSIRNMRDQAISDWDQMAKHHGRTLSIAAPSPLEWGHTLATVVTRSGVDRAVFARGARMVIVTVCDALLAMNPTESHSDVAATEPTELAVPAPLLIEESSAFVLMPIDSLDTPPSFEAVPVEADLVDR